MNVMYASGLAFVAEGMGVAIGILLLYLFNITNKRVIGMLFGTTSGIMIAMICFDVLPEALETGEKLLTVIGVIIGILLGLLLEDFTEMIGAKLHKSQSKVFHTALVLLIGIAIHNIPEGIALGTLALTSPDTILKFAFVICIHSIPEAMAIAIPMKMAGTSFKIVGTIPFLLGGIMAFGAAVGFVMSQSISSFTTVSLGLAAGLILYIVCQELLPESRKIWNGRMTTVATIVGIMVGMFLVG